MQLPEMTATDKLGHHWQVASVLLLTASVWTLCWWLSSLGLLDLAATAISYFAVQLARQIGGSISTRAPQELKPTATLLDQARADFRIWMRNRQLATHAIIALVATVAFLVGRFIASTVMTMIASPWLALAVGLAVAAMIASPVLVRSVINQFGRSKPKQSFSTTSKEARDAQLD